MYFSSEVSVITVEKNISKESLFFSFIKLPKKKQKCPVEKNILHKIVDLIRLDTLKISDILFIITVKFSVVKLTFKTAVFRLSKI